MSLATSGPISIGGTDPARSINAQFGRGATQQTSMSQLYRGGGIVGGGAPNVPTSGQISLSQFYGAANQFSFTISSNQTNANLRTLAVNAGWDQSAPVVATINSGIFISSNSTATPALTINGSFPGGVSLINNGTIAGMGGAGGNGGGSDFALAGSAGSAGGLALSATVGVAIDNQGTIAGGGGGGGGGQGRGAGSFRYGGGGGGGGRSSAAANSSGGALGSGDNSFGGVGGQGTVSGAGAGGVAVNNVGTPVQTGNGGNGGDWGSSGATGGLAVNGGRAGPYSGGSGGAAVSGNSNITWVATGTRLGAIT